MSKPSLQGKKMTARKKMTERDRVLEAHPRAYPWNYEALGWRIFPHLHALYVDCIGDGETELDAWASAARNLKCPK